jgi:hypothetical protein
MTMTSCFLIVWTLLFYSNATSQSPISDHFDTSHPVTIRGTVSGSLVLDDDVPACLFITVTDSKGGVQDWVIAGSPVRVVQRRGWSFERADATVKDGEPISILAYLPRQGSQAEQKLVEAVRNADRSGFKVADKLKQFRLAYGVEITLSNGTKKQFGEAK